jgi:hypothetical protein
MPVVPAAVESRTTWTSDTKASCDMQDNTVSAPSNDAESNKYALRISDVQTLWTRKCIPSPTSIRLTAPPRENFARNPTSTYSQPKVINDLCGPHKSIITGRLYCTWILGAL